MSEAYKAVQIETIAEGESCVQEEVRKLFDLGVTLIPVEFQGKAPLISRWQNRAANDNDANEFVGSKNVGMVLGKSSQNIIDIDLDDPIARELAPHFLPETGLVFGRSSSPRSHYLYKIDGETGRTERFQSKATGRPVLEYRSDKSQTVVPPSVHKTGEPIEWVRFDEPCIISRSELFSRLKLLVAAAVLAHRYEKGKRQDIVLAFSGAMLVSGVPASEIALLVEAICDRLGDEEKSQRLDAVARTVDKHTVGEGITQWGKLKELIGGDAVADIRKFLGLRGSDFGTDGLSGSSPSPAGSIPASDMTDTGVAKVFASVAADKIMYVEEMQTFFTYENGVWHRDIENLVALKVFDDFVQTMIADAAANSERSDSISQLRHWTRYRNRQTALNAIQQARSYLRQPMNLLDRDDCLFACHNGVIDLRTGELLPHSPTNFITVKSDVVWNPEAECPRFKTFLNTTFGGDRELIGYVQGIMGYFMTGRTDRQEFYICHGDGANGKSTLLNTVSHVLGALAKPVMAETLFAGGNRSGAAMADLSTLQGKRLAVAQEAESDARIHAALIKQLTGQDVLKVKPLYKNPYEFRPKFKIVLVANIRPNINVHDAALTRRVKLIPFAHVVEPRDRDPKLSEVLKDEASGILNFLIEGARMYFDGRILEPQVVKVATEGYLKDFDSVSNFLKAMTTRDPRSKVAKSELYEAYQKNCEENADVALSIKAFGQVMKQKGVDDTTSGATRYWVGIRLGSEQEASDALWASINGIGGRK